MKKLLCVLLMISTVLKALPTRVARAETHRKNRSAKSTAIVPVHIGKPSIAAKSAAVVFRSGLSHALESLSVAVKDDAEARRTLQARIARTPEHFENAVAEKIRACDAAKMEFLSTATARNAGKPIFDECLKPVHDYPEAINQNALVAEATFDACLHQLALWLKAKKSNEATWQAFECRRLVPMGKASDELHTPEVIGHLAASDAELKKLATPDAYVDADGLSCPVQINGVHMGVTPLALRHYAPGHYTVQISCDRAAPLEQALVHNIEIAPFGEPARLRVDTRFDSVFQPDSVELIYKTEQERDSYAVSDTVYLAKMLGLSHIWSFTAEAKEPSQKETIHHANPGASTVTRVDKIDVERSAVTASVWTSVPTTSSFAPQSPIWKAIASAEQFQRSIEVTAAGALQARSPWIAPKNVIQTYTQPRPSAIEEPRPLQSLGWMITGAGAISVASALTLNAAWLASKESNQSPWIGALGVGGGALLTTGFAMVLPPHSGVPWWSFLPPILGAGLAWHGLRGILDHGKCIGETDPLGQCSARVHQRSVGFEELGIALPLLSIPIIYGIRAMTSSKNPTDKNTSASIQVVPFSSRESVGIQLAGTM